MHLSNFDLMPSLQAAEHRLQMDTKTEARLSFQLHFYNTKYANEWTFE